MKKYLFTILSLITYSLCLFSCKNSIEVIQSVKDTGDACSIGFILQDGNGSERTAMPSFVWSDFEYTLSAKINGSNEETVLVTKKAFSNFDNGNQLPVEKGSYVFILTGYHGNDPVIKGISSTVNLTAGYTPVTFRMYALKGSTGSLELTVKLPKDNIITSAKACIVSSLSESVEGKLEAQDLVSVTDYRRVVYKKNNLPSATTQYAKVFFYDANGKEISSIIESIIIVGTKTSYAERIITESDYHHYAIAVNLIKDNSPWNEFSSITVKDQTNIAYVLQKTTDGYVGSVPEDTYTIYIDDDNTYAGFEAGESMYTVKFNTVELPVTGGIAVTPVSGGISGENSYIVPDNQNFTAMVTVKPGYSYVNNKVSVEGNQVEVGSNTEILSKQGLLSCSGVTPIEYTITYELDSGATWKNNTRKTTYTVEDREGLPAEGDLSKTVGAKTYDFDGWQIKGTTEKCSRIPDGVTENITLIPVWKEGVSIVDTVPEELADANEGTINGTIFACGYSLIIKWKDNNASTDFTEVYYDYNHNGIIDGDDKKVSDQNFNKFVLMAKTADGSAPASDFTFTMLGGNIASLIGLGSDKSNQSTVNISGTSIIGDGTSIGIDLPSLTNECVNIVGQMTGDYSITLLSGNKFNKNRLHRIAYINDATWAQLGHFTCLFKDDKQELEIGIQDYNTNQKVIYLLNPESIALPGKDLAEDDGGVIWIDAELNGKTQFTLGNSANITQPCSVFSLSVKNGKFQLQETASLYNDQGSAVSTINLGRTSVVDYESALHLNKDYYYIHMFSEDNKITAASVTEFLKTIKFIKDDENKDIELTVNLETMDYSEISNMKQKYGNTKFNYYDGSFYLGVTKDSKITWNEAYDEAKTLTFNGLSGYLITITSNVENGYIYGQMGLGQAWTGGSRLINYGTTEANRFDKSTFGYARKITEKVTAWNANNQANENVDKWYYFGNDYKNGRTTEFFWQCGPEAGTAYWKSSVYDNKENSSYGSYTNWDRSGSDNMEPNNYQDGNYKIDRWRSDSVPEDCMHFLDTGKWNDYKHYDPAVKSYIVEFTPYNTKYGKQVPTAARMTASAAY